MKCAKGWTRWRYDENQWQTFAAAWMISPPPTGNLGVALLLSARALHRTGPGGSTRAHNSSRGGCRCRGGQTGMTDKHTYQCGMLRERAINVCEGGEGFYRNVFCALTAQIVLVDCLPFNSGLWALMISSSGAGRSWSKVPTGMNPISAFVVFAHRLSINIICCD